MVHSAQAEAGPPTRDYLAWQLIETRRVADGGQMASYRLLLPEKAENVENLEVFYVVKPWNLSRSSGGPPAPDEIYRSELTGDADSLAVTIYCGRPARLEIQAGAMIDGRFHTAGTSINTYGRSGRPDSQAQRVGSLPDWPSLRLTRGAGYYRAQAGEELQFGLESPTSGPARTKVLDGGLLARPEPVGTASELFSYTPALDPPLSAPGYSVTRDLVAVAETDQAVLSYYLPVGRSRYGRLYLEPGLVIVGLAALLTWLAVTLAGRSFKWR